MADFSQLKRLHVDGAATADYEFIELEGRPVLTGVFAGESNVEYYNELIKRQVRNNRRFRAGGELGAAELQENRDGDRAMFPVSVFKRWSGVVDSKGKAVKFSAANCAEFLTALPDYLFDDLRNFFSNPRSFIVHGVRTALSDEESLDLGNS